MTSILEGGPGGSLNRDVTSIDDTDSPYTTTGGDILLVDTSGGAVTVTLATADATADPESSIRIYDSGENASSNNITVNTEGSENINPGTLSSVTLSVDGTWIDLQADGSNWFADLAPQVTDLTADTVTTNTSLTDANANTIADFAGRGLSVASNVLESDLDEIAVSSDVNTSGSGIYRVDTSGAARTLTLDTDDVSGSVIGVVNVSGTNDVTVDTEGSETIDPGGASSKTLSTEGWLVWFEGDGTNWDSSLDADIETAIVGEINNDGSAVDLGDFLNRLDMSDASTTTIFEALATNNAGAELEVQPTDGVSTSATTILDFPDRLRSAIVAVQGDERASSNRFFELVHYGGGASPSVVSTLTQNSPAGRTYTRAIGQTLQLAMASGTYDVTASALTATRDQNATS